MQTDWPSSDPDVRRYYKALVEAHARRIAQMPNMGADSDQSWYWVTVIAKLHKNATDDAAHLFGEGSKLKMARARKAAAKRLGSMFRIRGTLIESWRLADRTNMMRIGVSSGLPIGNKWQFAFACTLHSATPQSPNVEGDRYEGFVLHLDPATGWSKRS
ncbi:hypothetical protein ACFCYH_18235 [Streptomyces sp. NPDC056400]|uniref:hypothetical protein n=1 Tax=Streptomyces sp. NPDC056400 TaxID=3345808 RepID=UPI0035E1462B